MIATMQSWGAHVSLAWWQWMGDMSIQIVAFVVVVAVVDRIWGRYAWPQQRVWLWSLVMLKLLVPPTLISPISVTNVIADIAPDVAAGVSPIDAPLGIAATSSNFLFSVLTVVWLTGLVATLVFGAVRYRRLQGQLRLDCASTLPCELGPAVQRAAQQLGLRSLPRVELSRALRSPAVAGILRPVIYLPRRVIDESTPEQLQHVLMHEMAHIQRRDPLIHALCLLVHAAYWFHPAVWFATRRLATLREEATDRMVASRLAEGRLGYRDTLLSFAERLLDEPGVSQGSTLQPRYGHLGFIHPQSPILSRLAQLERHSTKHATLRRATNGVLVAILLTCVLPMGRPVAAPTVDPIAAGCMVTRLRVMQAMAARDQFVAHSPARDLPARAVAPATASAD